MSLMLYHYSGDPAAPRLDESLFRQMAARLKARAAPRVIAGRGVFAELVSPDLIYAANGAVYGSDADLTADLPRGAYETVRLLDGVKYALREDEEEVRLSNDLLGSVTLWYVAKERELIVSSSLRLLVMLAGEYRPDREAFKWFLCNGQLCPGRSWAEGVRPLPGGHELRYRFRDGALTVERLVYPPAGRAAPESLETAVPQAVGRVKVTPGMRLALSGGVDSRVVLYEFLRRGVRMPCITYGAPEYADLPGYDTAIARAVAERAGVDLWVLELRDTVSSLPVERLYERYQDYVANMEGAGDDFRFHDDIIDRLRDGGTTSLLVGDEAFGWTFVADELQARQMVGINLFSDFRKQEPLYDRLAELMPQAMPPGLEQAEGETAPAWRDRLYRMCRLPCFVNPFSSRRSLCMNSVRPFLYNSLVTLAERLPDRDRTDKARFRRYGLKLEREVLGRNLPRVGTKPFPAQDAPSKYGLLLDLALFALQHSVARDSLYDPDLVAAVHEIAKRRRPAAGAAAGAEQRPSRLLAALKSSLPKSLKYQVKRRLGGVPSRDVELTIQYGRLLLRMAIVCTTVDLLMDDAHILPDRASGLL